MRQFAPGEGQHVHFALVARSEADVAPFAAQRDPAVFRRDHARHTQARARTEQTDDAVGARHAAADLLALVGPQIGQGHGQRREVIHHQQGVEAQRGAHRLDREEPVMVHHADIVVVDGIGDGDGRMAHARRTGGARLVAVHICGDGVEQRRVVVAGQHGHRFQVALARFQHEAGIGAADVGQQAGAFTETFRRIAACYFHFFINFHGGA
ncbi:hypothetical protein D3C87_1308280 [compost metagenome]